jgi:hypothetical protein
VLGATLGKIFSAVTALVINNILPSARPNKFCRQLGHLAKCFFIFFKKLLCQVPLPRHSAKIFLIFLKKITLPSAPTLALGKVFFYFF